MAASALGIARASLEFTVSYLKDRGVKVRYGVAPHLQTAVERDLIHMEMQHRAGWLLVLKAVTKMDAGQENALEASMAKVKAGQVATYVSQKAVELLGPEGYSCKLLVEKVDARRPHQRYLRGHRSDQSPDRCATPAWLYEPRVALMRMVVRK